MDYYFSMRAPIITTIAFIMPLSSILEAQTVTRLDNLKFAELYNAGKNDSLYLFMSPQMQQSLKNDGSHILFEKLKIQLGNIVEIKDILRNKISILQFKVGFERPLI